jgi:hypothetical protein
MSKILYRDIDKSKDEKQEGDEFFDCFGNWAPIDKDSIASKMWLDNSKYRRPLHLDLDGGKYRALEAKDHSRTDIEYFNTLDNVWGINEKGFHQGVVYRVPVEQEPAKEPVQCEQIMLACATTGKKCKSRGIEKDCELKTKSFDEES